MAAVAGGVRDGFNDVLDGDGGMPRLPGHRAPWLAAMQNAFGHRVIVLRAEMAHDRSDSARRTAARVTGVLPLMLVRGPIFGKFLVSLPYVNTGGLWAADNTSADALIDAACELADQLDVKQLELRHEQPHQHPRFNLSKTQKVHMRMALPPTGDDMMASLKSKVRSQVKKSLREPFSVHIGRQNLLSDFYDVFAVNMRDLGTPVFAKRLFMEILDSFGDDAEIVVLRDGDQPIAGALLVHDGATTEVPSASCLRHFNRRNANMAMYWHLITHAIDRGSTTFDFGRSSRDSGTFRFKKQWGAQPSPAHWQYYVRRGDPEAMRPDSDGNRRLIEIWKRLPVGLTRIIGPPIVRGIP